MKHWVNVGKHLVRIEGDIFVCINDGPVSLDEMIMMTKQIEHMVKTAGVRFFLMDLTHTDGPSPEARRWMALNPYCGIDAVAGYGASLALKIMSDLTRRAMNALRRPEERTPFRLFTTEAEARAFFQTLRDSRPQLGSGLPAPTT